MREFRPINTINDRLPELHAPRSVLGAGFQERGKTVILWER